MTVHSRLGTHRGMRTGDVVVFDLPAEQGGRRYHVLVSEGVQMHVPSWNPPERSGWWYVDLVDVDVAGDVLTLRDRHVDLLVSPDGSRYRIVDLDELAAELRDGRLTSAEAAATLAATQAFLDRHLQGPDSPPGVAPDFPPAGVG